MYAIIMPGMKIFPFPWGTMQLAMEEHEMSTTYSPISAIEPEN